MKTIRHALAVLAVCTVAHAAQTTYATLTCPNEIRRMSFASDALFRDMLGGIGGVGMADAARYPQAKSRFIAKIQVIVPYDNVRTGIERWTIAHDGDKGVAYILYFVPDGHDGTNFGVKLDDRRN
jgi:hypothetical protein